MVEDTPTVTIDADVQIGINDESIVKALRAMAELTNDEVKAHDLETLADSFEQMDERDDEDAVETVADAQQWIVDRLRELGYTDTLAADSPYSGIETLEDIPEESDVGGAVYIGSHIDVPVNEIGSPDGWTWLSKELIVGNRLLKVGDDANE